MKSMQIEMPEDVEQEIEEAAKVQHVSLNDFMVRALIEKLSRAVPDPYLEKRARRANRKAFEEFLAKVPDVPPDDYDKLE